MTESIYLERINKTPHSSTLGMKLFHAEENAVTLVLPYSEKLIGDPDRKVIHGGAITSLIDSACGTAVFQAQNNMRAMATLDLRIDYMRPSPAGEDVYAYAECYHLTPTIAFVRATAYNDDPKQPVATGMATFMRSNQNFPE